MSKLICTCTGATAFQLERRDKFCPIHGDTERRRREMSDKSFAEFMEERGWYFDSDYKKWLYRKGKHKADQGGESWQEALSIWEGKKMSKNIDIAQALHMLGQEIHANNIAHGFWPEGTKRNQGEMIALMHSELSEALEAIRHKEQGHQPSEHVPAMSALAEEMADVVIRVLDFCAAFDIDLGRAICSKMAFNEGRPHKHGKEF